nr:hypothetical protein [Tanacetum cinerariifolium]
MSTQQDIYAAGFESRPPMLNKENYVPWSSRLLRYAKSRPNEKLIYNSILNGPYVRRMIPELGDANCEVTVTETFHMQTDDKLSNKELKHIGADDQAIQTILLGLPEDIYAVVDSCETAQEIWFTSNERESIESYYHHFLKLMNDLKRNKYFPEKIASNLKFLNNLQPEWSRHVTIVHQTKDLHTADYTQLYDFLKYNQKKNYLQQPMPNPEDITDPTTAMNMALALMANAFKLNYSSSTNNNQRISSNLRNRQIAQLGMNMGQDRQMQMVGGNGGNQFRQYAGQNAWNLTGYNDVIGNQVIQNAVQNPKVQNIGNQNGLIGVQWNGNQNQIGNGNLVVARAEGNAAGQNGNHIRGCRVLPNEEIFAELARMGYEKPSTMLTFYKEFFLRMLVPQVQDDIDVADDGKLEESQAQVYHLDSKHAQKVLSMQDDEVEPAELKEVIEVVTTAKLMTKVVTAVATTITVAPSAAMRRKGVVIRDPEETTTPSFIVHFESKSKEKEKGILVEEPKPLKK